MGMLTGTAINRLIVEIPVRHGKSIYCSHILPCWHCLVQPNKNVLVVSYGGIFASEWSSRNRDLVRDWGPKLTGVGVHPEFASRSHFRLAPPHVGEHRGMGIGGPLAGTGASLIIADDLIKEFSEVATEEARDRIYLRFHGELLNRLEPGGKIIVVMSRRHPDDLSGRLLASNSQLDIEDQWHSIRFPALSEDGIALWPERYPAKRLRSIQRDLELAGTPWIWSGLYQQDAAGAIAFTDWPASFFKDVLYEHLPAFRPRFRLMSLDPSCGKDARAGDFAALLKVLIDSDGCWWVDPALVRIDLEALTDLAVLTAREFLPANFAIETNGFQEFVALDVHRKDGSIPILAYCNVEKKEVRIRVLLSALLSAKKLRIRDTIQGRIMLQQLRDFPQANHDDGPDALALCVQMLGDLMRGVGKPEQGDMAIMTN